MNKKLLLGALLVCGMGATITGCVDDTESASVTAVRNAKAEQIKALAGLSDAQAQAALINANAVKAAQEAQAALFQAQAAQAEAQAAYQNAQTESAKAAAEEAMARAEVAKQKAANELQTLATQLEIDMLNQKKDLLDAQNAYESALKQGDTQQLADLQLLLNNYNSASSSLISAQYWLAINKIDLANLEAGLVNTKENAKTQIAQENEKIAKAQAEIDGLQAELDTYQNYGSAAEAQKQLEAAGKEKDTAYNTYTDADVANDLAQQKLNEAQTAMDDSAYQQNVETCPALVIEGWNIGSYYNNNTYYGAWSINDKGEYVYLPLFNGGNWTSKSIEWSYGEGQRVNSLSYDLADNYYTPVKDGYANLEKTLKAAIDANEGAAVKTADAAVTKAQADVTAAKTVVTANETTLKAAQDAVKTAGDKATQAQKDAVTAAETALNTAKTNLTTAEETLKTAQTSLKTANDNLASVNANLAKVKAYYDKAVAGLDSYNALVKTYNDASKGAAETTIAEDKAWNTFIVANKKYNALSTIANGGSAGNIVSQIESLNNQINAQKQNIQNSQALIAQYEQELAADDDPNKVAAIEQLKSQIAQQETEISALEKKVEMAKAQLDAAMADSAE